MEKLKNEHFEYWKKASATSLQKTEDVRHLWFDFDPATTPYRPRYNEQQQVEHTDIMREVPRAASCGGTVGESQQAKGVPLLQGDIYLQEIEGKVLQSQLCKSLGLGEEEIVARVSSNVANRVDRLKTIGNGQVPMCAAVAFDILSEGLITPTI